VELTSTHDVKIKHRNILSLIDCGGRNSVVTIETAHGSKVLGFEPHGSIIFPEISISALGPIQPPVYGYGVTLQGIDQPELGLDHIHTSRSEVKERVKP